MPQSSRSSFTVQISKKSQVLEATQVEGPRSEESRSSFTVQISKKAQVLEATQVEGPRSEDVDCAGPGTSGWESRGRTGPWHLQVPGLADGATSFLSTCPLLGAEVHQGCRHALAASGRSSPPGGGVK